MHIRRLLALLALGFGLIGALLVGATTAHAQGPARYYPPAGPTLPSQLNYFRRDVGILDQYNAFVHPRQQIDHQLQQLAVQQQANYRTTRRQLDQLQEIRAAEASPTGVGASFMNYGHYYRLPTRGAAQARLR